MGFFRKSIFFAAGGCSYVGLEFLWRGWSHSSMFLAGGSCFLLLGQLQKRTAHLPLAYRGFAGAGIITGIELLTGLLANRDFRVWDYRNMPGNFLGQICLPWSLLWIPVGLGGMYLYKQLDKLLPQKDI